MKALRDTFKEPFNKHNVVDVLDILLFVQCCYQRLYRSANLAISDQRSVEQQLNGNPSREAPRVASSSIARGPAVCFRLLSRVRVLI